MAHSGETSDVIPISVWQSRQVASSHRKALLCARPCSLVITQLLWARNLMS